MNFLYSRNNAKFHVVLSGHNCPDFYAGLLPTTLNTISYTPTAIAQNGDWFKVDLSSLADVTNPILELEKKVSTSLPTINGTQYKDIKYLIFKRQSDDFYYIQKVLPSAKIYRKTLSFSNQPEVLDNPIVVLTDSPDAIFDKNTGHLYFKSLSAMNSIFKGLNTLYRAATTTEVTQFFQLGGLLAVDPSYTVDKVGIPNRKNIAKALDTYNAYSPQVRNSLHSYIQTLGLPTDANGKYTITDEESLKNFVYAIQERFYTTQASTEKRLAQAYVPV